MIRRVSGTSTAHRCTALCEVLAQAGSLVIDAAQTSEGLRWRT